MESLALLVALMLGVITVGGAVALGLTLVRRRWAQITALVLSVPGGFLSVNLLISVDSTGSRVLGALGLGLAMATWFRAVRWLRAAN